MTHSKEPELVVLLSGGIDSMACIHFYLSLGRPLCTAFIDYGHLAAPHEANASVAISRYFGVPLRQFAINGASHKSSGEIRARNLMLLSVAAMEHALPIQALVLGIHAGTRYPDCSLEFLSMANSILTLQIPSLSILAPFVSWTKSDVLAYVEHHDLPVRLTYSCEEGTIPPCGRCQSCLDRRTVDAGS